MVVSRSPTRPRRTRAPGGAGPRASSPQPDQGWIIALLLRPSCIFCGPEVALRQLCERAVLAREECVDARLLLHGKLQGHAHGLTVAAA